MNIIRGDSYRITFGLKNNGEPYILREGDQLTFTVKQNTNLDKAIIVKRWGDGITYNPITKKYEIEITGDCSCNTKCVSLGYDIEIVVNGKVKTLDKDKFNIIQDYTKPNNREVG